MLGVKRKWNRRHYLFRTDLQACSIADAGWKNRTPGSMNPILDAPVSSIISAYLLIAELAARVQFNQRDRRCILIPLSLHNARRSRCNRRFDMSTISYERHEAMVVAPA